MYLDAPNKKLTLRADLNRSPKVPIAPVREKAQNNVEQTLSRTLDLCKIGLRKKSIFFLHYPVIY